MACSNDESFRFCQRLARRTARNFYFSFFGLPPQQFRAMCVLYAFMRICDDIGDEEMRTIADRRHELSVWEAALRSTLQTGHAAPISEGSETLQSGGRVLPALVIVAREFQIPESRLLTVLDGVRMDLDFPALPGELRCRFQTFEELEQYCFKVAGVVGQCCLSIWGYRDERALDLAIDCGLAFQLTNILRDLAEDAQAGRVYLPEEDLLRFGYAPDDIRKQIRDERFTRLMQFEAERAQQFYERAAGLFELLEPPGRPILEAMLKLYRGLLDRIIRRNFDVYLGRVRLPVWRKLAIAAGAMLKQSALRWNPPADPDVVRPRQ